MVLYINGHGGWTLCGWHRRGIINQQEGDEGSLLSMTKGHIVLLYPTQPNTLNDAQFRHMLIPTPEITSSDSSDSNTL